eukprot:5491127-Pyramimonas_sp.AAC.1
MVTHIVSLSQLAVMEQTYVDGIPTFGNPSLDVISKHSVDALLRCGILVKQESEFGDEVMDIDWRKVRWESHRVAFGPVQFARRVKDACVFRDISKVSLRVAFLDMGWAPERRPEPIAAADIID